MEIKDVIVGIVLLVLILAFIIGFIIVKRNAEREEVLKKEQRELMIQRYQKRFNKFITNSFSGEIPDEYFETVFNSYDGSIIIILNDKFLKLLSQDLKIKEADEQVVYWRMVSLLEEGDVKLFEFIDVPLANKVSIET
jgi:hypothetical protein